MTQPQPLDLDAIEARAAEHLAALSGWLNCYSPLPEQEALEGAEGVLKEDVAAMAAEIRRLRAEAERRTEDIASADNPTQLRWGLDDVMWGDDDTVTVLLSGPAGEPYWLELDPERAAVLRENLAGPAAVEAHVVADDSSDPDRCGARHHQYPDTVCTEPPGHYRRAVDPHAGPLVIDGRERGGAAWDEPAAASAAVRP